MVKSQIITSKIDPYWQYYTFSGAKFSRVQKPHKNSKKAFNA